MVMWKTGHFPHFLMEETGENKNTFIVSIKKIGYLMLANEQKCIKTKR
jgi:hypothetical protein